MIPQLRTILTWLGFLLKTSGPLVGTAVRRGVSLIRKLCLGATRAPLQMLFSRLFAVFALYVSGPWVAPAKGNPQSEAVDFTAASVICSTPIPENDLQNTPSSSAQLLQVNSTASIRCSMPTPENAVQSIPSPSAQLFQPNLAEPGHSCTPVNSRPPSVLPTEWEFKPCAPKSWKRYRGRPLVSRDNTVKPIPAKKKAFVNTPVDGWERVIHPEGAPYFYHATRRVFTDAHLMDKRILRTVDGLADWLISEAGVMVDGLTCLALELPERGSNVCNYYFVQHDERLLFWVHDFVEPMSIFENVEGVKSDSHIKIALEAQYWMHCELYPNNAPIKPEIATELKYILLHANADFLTSDTSVVPYDLPKLQNMLDLTTHVVEFMTSQPQPHSQLQGLPPPSGRDAVELPAHLMCVLARLMRLFARSKFLNFFGQVSARLSANQSIYIPESTRTQFTTRLRLANFFLCGAPAAQYKFLRETWIDDILNYPRWSKYISRLNSDWNGVTIFSTVMLAVDISFLAVPGVVTGSAVLVSLSAMCSVSSLVVSMVLGGESRGWGTDSAEGAASFMARKVGAQSGIEALAIMYSLPYAFLIWGMLCFVGALGNTVFRYQSPTILSVIAIGWVVVTCLTLWPVWWGKLSIAPPSAPSFTGRRQPRRQTQPPPNSIAHV